MKNRDKYILQRNEYDMLLTIQAAFGYGMCQCVIEALTGREYPCENDKCCMLSTCEECIRQWLNKEEDE